jgi:RHS repeat-associated protein
MSKSWVSLTLLGLLLLVSAPGSGGDADQPSAVWIADTREVLKLGASDARLLLEIPEAAASRALAVDHGAGVLWAYGAGRLRAFDLKGQLLLETQLTGAAHQGASGLAPGLAVMVRAAGGLVWVADGKQLTAYGLAGQLLWSQTLSAAVHALALDAARGLLWVATASGVTSYGAEQGDERQALALGERPQVVAIAADPATGTVWVAHRDRLQAHTGDAVKKLEVPADPADPFRAIAADGEGGLWAAGATWLARLDGAGRVQAAVSPFAGQGRIGRLCVDPVGGDAWVASDTELARVSRAGVVLRRLAFEPPLQVLDMVLQGAAETLATKPPALPPVAAPAAEESPAAGVLPAATPAAPEAPIALPQSAPGQTTIIGKVLLPNQAPASGMTVSVLGEAASATTAADGSFSIPNVAGAAGQTLQLVGTYTAPGGQVLFLAQGFGANPGGTYNAYSITLQPACSEDYASGLFPTNALSGTGTVQVNALAPFGTALVAAGAFSKALIGGTSTTVNNIAAWNGTAWAKLGSGSSPGVSGGSSPAVQALAAFSGKLYVGGTFTSAGGVAVANIASWDGTNWAAVGSGLPGTVYALGVWNGALYAGGAFTTSGSTHFNHIAKLSGTSWVPVGNGFDNNVLALTAFDDGTGGGVQLYAGGSFVNSTLKGTARWNAATSTWVALGGGVTGTVGGVGPLVDTFASRVESGTPTLYAGGSFTAAGGVTTAGVARWQSSAWSAAGSALSGTAGLANRVNALAFLDDGAGSYLYAAGNFSGAPNNYNRLAYWDPISTQWQPVYNAAGTTAGFDNTVNALAAWAQAGTPPQPTFLYVGGAFGKAGGYTSVRMARWGRPLSCADTVAPVLAITAPPYNGAVNSAKPSIGVAIFEIGSGLKTSSLQIQLNGATVSTTCSFGSGTATCVPVNSLADGVYTAAASAQDNAGNQAVNYATGRFTIDTVPPSVSITMPAEGSFVAASQSIRLAYSDAGVGVDPTSVTLQLNGGALAASCTGDAVGALCHPTQPLAAGAATLIAMVRDLAGNSATSAPRHFTVANTSTTVTGSVQMSDGSAAAGAQVSVLGQGTAAATSAADGSFSIAGVAAESGQALTVIAQKTVNGAPLVGVAANLAPVLGGTTNAGILILLPTCGPRFVDGLFPGTGVSGDPVASVPHRQVSGVVGFNDGSGPALYAWGDFSYAGGSVIGAVARWNGTRWSDAGLAGAVYGMQVADLGSGPTLYAFGATDLSYQGINLHGLARWTGTGWSSVGNGTDGYVASLAVFNDGSGPALYVAGNFQSVNYVPYWNGQFQGLAAPGSAKWNGTTWTAIPSSPTGNITRFVAANSLLYGLDGASYLPANLYQWGGSAWTLLRNFPSYVASAGVVTGGGIPGLYIGSGTAIDRWDGHSWTVVSPAAGQAAGALYGFDDGTAPAGQKLFLAGSFCATSCTMPSLGVFKWDGASWTTTGAHLDGEGPEALGSWNDGTANRLVAGGQFRRSPQGLQANGVEELVGSALVPLGHQTIEGASPMVQALLVWDDGTGAALYVAGTFTSVNGTPANDIARWDGTTWSALRGGLGAGSVLDQVQALEVYNGALYAGGHFTLADGQPAANLARWDGLSWTAMTLGSATVGYDEVLALRAWNGALYAGGTFADFGYDGHPINRIAKWDGTGWLSPGSGVDGANGSNGSKSYVGALAVYNNALYAAGNFASIGGVAVDNAAAWNGAGWSSIGAPPSFEMRALTAYDDGTGAQLFLGGYYLDPSNGPGSALLASSNGSSASALTSPLDKGINSLAAFNDGSGAPALYLGGSFTEIPPGLIANRFVRDRQSVLTRFWPGVYGSTVSQGSGVSGAAERTGVLAMAVFDDGSGSGPALFLGGDFTGAGNTNSSALAKWVAPLQCTDAIPIRITLTSPVDGALTTQAAQVVAGSVNKAVTLTLNGQPVTVGSNLTFTVSVTLLEGPNTLQLAASDSFGNTAQLAVTVTLDTTPPQVSWIAPPAGAAVGTSTPTLRLAYSDSGTGVVPSSLTLHNGTAIVAATCVYGSAAAVCTPSQALPAGAVTLTAQVMDRAGNASLPAAVSFVVNPVAGGAQTTVTGSVLTGSVPVAGARVLVLGKQGASATTAADGTFSIAAVDVSSGTALTVTARANTAQGWQTGVAAGIAPQPGGITNAGAIELRLGCDPGFAAPLLTEVGVDGGTARVMAQAVFDDGRGPALYVGGSFSQAGGIPAANLARWDGHAWTAVAGGVNGTVRALTVYDDGHGPALYVGGNFNYVGTAAGTVTAVNIAKWNGSAWSALPGSGTNGVTGIVYALAVHNDGSGLALYAGGSFNSAGGSAASNLARWNGTAWSVVGSPTNGTDSEVFALASFNGLLIAGGEFRNAGGHAAASLAQWNGSAWSAVSTGTDRNVYALQVWNGALYIAGNFLNAGTVQQPVYGIVRWDGAGGWSGLGAGLNEDFFPSFDGPQGVQALGVFDDGQGPKLYATGQFYHGGVTNLYQDMARWDGTAWSPVGGGIDVQNTGGAAFAVYDDGAGPALYAGGSFTAAGGIGVHQLARWKGKGWSAVGPAATGADAGIATLAVFDDGTGPALYAGGDFTTAAGLGTSHAARWDGVQWSQLGAGTDARISSLTVLPNSPAAALVAGGDFTHAGGLGANRAASWSGAGSPTWSALGGGAAASVRAVAALDAFASGTTVLYAGGDFTSPAPHVASWNGTSWSGLGSGVDGTVRAIVAFQPAGQARSLYVAGDFQNAGGSPAAHVARWDGAHWSPLGGGLAGPVYALAVFDDGSGPALYAGSVGAVMRWNGSAWTQVGDSFNNFVYAFAAFDDGTGPALFAGGSFTYTFRMQNGAPLSTALLPGLARWDGTSWSAPLTDGTVVPGLTAGTVGALAVWDDGSGPALWSGGDFYLGSTHAYLARWSRPTVCVDRHPPVIAFTAPTENAAINSSTPELDLNYSDPENDAATGTLAVTNGGAALAVTCVYGPTAGQCRPTAAIPDGPVHLSATMADLAGNVSAAAAVDFVIDTQPPVFNFTLPANNALLTTASADVKMHYADAGSGIDLASLSLSLSSTVSAAFQCTANASDADCTPAAALADGVYTFYGTVRDLAGNASPQAQVTFIVDTQPPQLAITSPASGSSTNRQQPPIALTYGDAGSGVDTTTLQLTANGSALPVSCTFAPASAVCTPVAPLAAGAVTLAATIKDHAGHTSPAAGDSFTIVLDTTPPAIIVTTPVPGSATNQASQQIAGSLSKPATLTLNGAAVTVGGNNAFSYGPVTLSAGSNAFTLAATDAVGNASQLTFTVLLDTTPPVLAINAPAAGATFDPSVTPIQLAWSDAGGAGIKSSSLTLTANGSALPVTCATSASGASCTSNSPLAGGPVTLSAQVADNAGNLSASAQVAFTAPAGSSGLHPIITVVSPTPNGTINNAQPMLIGRLNEPATLTLNGQPVTVASDLTFSTGPLSLSPGSNSFSLVATDAAGNVGQLTFTLTLDTAVPAAIDTSRVTVTSGAPGQVTVSGAAGAVPVGETGLVAVIANAGIAGEVTAPVGGDGSFTAQVAALPGDMLLLSVRNPGGNQSTVASLQVTGTPPVPPDPATVAPVPDPTAATNVCARTAFLWSGTSLVQYGVASGAIDCRRVAILRGRALDRSGAAVSGVRISADGHPELGSTFTRADGRFDFAVNGGGNLVLRYAKSGYLRLERRLQPLWSRFVAVPDVALTQPDTRVTAIDLTSSTPIQVARGTAVSDGAGSRQATLLFAQGTTAAMVLPGGASLPLTSLQVRATETSANDAGPSAVPADLPAHMDFTYGLELTVDQAEAAGASSVTFNQPVPVYVENFLHFPVGQVVPAAYFDRQQGVWVPASNGLVLAVLSVTGGKADLDLTGTGQPASAATLAALGITDAERQQLPALYAPGQQLWRQPVSHFTPWEYSWPWDLPVADPIPNVALPSTADDGKIDKPAVSLFGGAIETENQVLHESLTIPGSPLTLNYSSDRAPGRKAPYLLTIPLTDTLVPPDLKRVDLEIDVAGQQILQSFPASAAQTMTFQWNGLDAYGTPWQGAAPWVAKVGYVYTGEYQVPDSGDPAFGVISGIRIQGSATRHEVTVTRESSGQIGGLDARAAFGFGGWSLSVHHYFNPVDRTLYYGSGGRRSFGSAASSPNVLTLVAGNGQSGLAGDGGLARNAQLSFPTGLSVMSDGSLLIADMGNCRIRKVDTQGNITTIAGSVCADPTGNSGFGAGGPASLATLHLPSKAIEGPGGSIYIADTGHGRVLKVDASGVITSVAGSGTPGCTGDGSPATAQLTAPVDIAFDRAGNLLIADVGQYLVDTSCSAIRQLSPAGNMTTLATDLVPPGSPTRTPVVFASGVAAGQDGSVYFTQWHSVRRIPPDHQVDPAEHNWTIAGVSNYALHFGFAGDGKPAARDGSTLFDQPFHVALDRDRNIYIADRMNGRIRRISSTNIVDTVVGGGPFLPVSDGVLATDAALLDPRGVALDPTGRTLYVSDAARAQVWKVTAPLPFGDSTFSIASEDGRELYVFDSAGRHLRTENAVTGQAILTFGYAGYPLPGATSGQRQLLTSIQDAFGNVTTIERAADGTPQAIDAAFGQHVPLGLDGNGYLASLVRTLIPAAETVNLTTSADGLLQSLRDPKGALYSFSYDPQGRLSQVQDPAQGSLGLTYQGGPTGYSVALASAMNRDSKMQVVSLPSGGIQKTATDTAGLVTTGILKPDGSLTITSPDQTTVEIDKTPDPRLGALAPYTKTVILTTPVNHLVYSAAASRTVGVSATDPLGLLLQTDTVTVNNRTASTTYDASQRQVTSTSPEGRQRVSLFDTFGRVVQSQVPGFQPVNYAYDAKSRLQSVTQGLGSEQRTLTYTYNPQGFVDSVTDPLLHVTHFQYDSVGRVLKTTLADQRQIQAAYDLDGNLTALTPPSRPEHDFSYDPVSEVVAYTPPAAVPGNPATTYSYNADHQLLAINRPDGQTVTFNYDNTPSSQGSSCSPSCASGRLRSVALPQGTLALAYDPLTGKLVSVVSPDGQTLSYTYDGPLTTEIKAQGPAPGVIDLQYDTNFWVTSRRINGDFAGAVQFKYDRDGLITQAADVQVYRDPTNGMLLGTQVFNGVDVITRSDLGEVKHYEAGYIGGCSGGVPPTPCTKFLVEDYQRDQVARITQKVETTLDSLTGSPVTHTYVYAYDVTGRLTVVTRDGAAWETYAYDGNGNRTSWTDVTGSGVAVYDSQDRLLTYADKTYTYTANGELASKTQGGQTNTYAYDVLGNLRHVTLASGVQIDYLVDGLNRRIGKKISGTLVQGFLYQGGIAPLAQLDGAGNVVSLFTYASGRRVPEEMVQGGVAYRIITDPLGSVRAVANAQTGQILQRLDYDAFGRVILDTNPGFQPFGYAGGLYDYQTGLVRFGARDYDAETGRWTTKDPVGFGGGSTSLYAYVANDPVNSLDPLGLADPARQDCDAIVDDTKTGVLRGGMKVHPLVGIMVGEAAGALGHLACIAAFSSSPSTGAETASDALFVAAFGLSPAPVAEVATPIPQILINAARGKAFENSVLAALDAQKNTVNLGGAIPDIVDMAGMTEIKDALYVTNTPQLRTEAARAVSDGVPFNLIVSPRTQSISAAVQQAVDLTNGVILVYDPTTGVFTPW